MQVDFSHLKTAQPRPTINGKLVGEANRLEQIDSRLQDLTQQIECLGTEIVADEQRDRKEYINQLKALKLSVQRMEQFYGKWLSLSLATVAVLTISCLWMGINRQQNSNKSQHNSAAVAVLKQGQSHT